MTPCEQHSKEHGHHFPDVRRQQISQEFPDIREDRPTFFDCGDDGGEIVVGEHDVGRLLRDIGTRDPHRDADVSHLKGRGIVDAVTGHGYDGSLPLEGLHDPQLVFRIDAGINRRVLDHLSKGNVRGPLEFGTGDRSFLAGDAKVHGDDAGGLWMISGNHHRPYSCSLRSAYGVSRLVARGVDHADEPGKHEVLLDAFVDVVVRYGTTGKDSIGDGQCAQRAGGELFVRQQNLQSPRIAQGPWSFAYLFLRTVC